MAITNNGTRLLIPTRQVPDGLSLTAATTFTDIQYRRTLELSTLKSLADGATSIITVTAIVADIASQVDAIIAADFIATATVDFWTDIVSLTSTNTPNGGDDAWLSDVAPSYITNVVIYVKSN